MSWLDLGQPLGDLGCDGLGHPHVVEDVLVGRRLGVAQRVRVDRVDLWVARQHVVHPVVVAAAVVDHE